MLTRWYVGTVDAPLEWRVHVEEEGKPPRPLPLRLDLRNHSPTGFAWGYWGSGPAQLALALLADAAGPALAERLYQDFKVERIGRLSQSEGWRMSLTDILEWVVVAGMLAEGRKP